MSQFEIVAAQEVRRLPAKDGWPEKAVDHYTLKQNGSQILATAFRKLEEPIPKPGDVIEGELGENDRFDKDRRKFSTARKGGAGGFRKRDPAESRRIERQHSQHMALEYIRIKASIGALPQEPNGKQGFDLSDVFQIADKFDEDLNPAPPASELPLDENQ